MGTVTPNRCTLLIRGRDQGKSCCAEYCASTLQLHRLCTVHPHSDPTRVVTFYAVILMSVKRKCLIQLYVGMSKRSTKRLGMSAEKSVKLTLCLLASKMERCRRNFCSFELELLFVKWEDKSPL